MASADVYVDGVLVGSHNKPQELVKQIIERRRKGRLPKNLNVAFHEDTGEVHINLYTGRVRRPLIVVENGKPLLTPELKEQVIEGKITWDELERKGIIEYLDAEEEENALIALSEEDVTPEHTHLEIDPALILGVSSSMLVFPEKNRGDRLNYGSRMAVQACGIPISSFLLRDDTTMHVLVYPQVPLVRSESTTATGLETHPNGENLVVAIMPFYGYNIEDAIILNKASLERGAMRLISYRTFSTEARKYWGGQVDSIEVPDKGVKNYRAEQYYRHLDEQGVINPETEVKEDDVLVGKVSPLRFLGVAKEVRMGIDQYRDNSLTVKQIQEGVVEKVVLAVTDEGNKIVKVTIRDTAMPEVGDKFATRHGQKGVVGLIVPEEDMPFTANGTTPDIIINPHAIPSRMTVGQLLEILAGKAGAMIGERIDGTAFRGSEEAIREGLKACGFRSDGKEAMYNGITGEKLEAEIFIGIGYYYRLYHLVSKKIHARSRGPVALLTKQPTAGRAKGGGLRLGEMEKDCLVAHGAPIVLRERFGSDMVLEPVCKECGNMVIKNYITGRAKCPNCGSEDVVYVSMSYAFKLLVDELKSMTVAVRIKPETEE